MRLAMNTALSGMQAAGLRLETAARNIANAGIADAMPATAQQSSLVEGGATTTLPRISPGFVTAIGAQSASDVDLATEITTITSAKHDFMANAEILRTWNEMLQRLFDLADDRA